MATDCPAEVLDSRTKQSLRRRLLAWYARHARDLPWRRSRDPYRVWLSEVMLQQTTVAAVEPYFRRFTAAFPTVAELAAAEESQVLRLWEGLGYYRRARSLHAAAKRIVAEHGGRLPDSLDELLSLPGVGRYTAGAILSIAFDRPAPILEANTVRLLSRLIGYRGDPAKAAGQRLLWRTAEELLPKKDVARFNQALMELGSLVCTPAAPRCDACPIARCCAAKRDGLQDQIPAATRKLKFTDVREAAVVVRKNGAVLLRRCGEGERWSGLWDFPRFELTAEEPRQASREIAAKVREQTGVAVEPGERLATLRHGVTRFRITLECYAARPAGGRLRSTAERPVRWTLLAELGELPLSTTGRKLAKLVTKGS
jgi:A/G-specific adenine glycosylase